MSDVDQKIERVLKDFMSLRPVQTTAVSVALAEALTAARDEIADLRERLGKVEADVHTLGHDHVDLLNERPAAHHHLDLHESVRKLTEVFDAVGRAHVAISRATANANVEGSDIDERVQAVLARLGKVEARAGRFKRTLLNLAADGCYRSISAACGTCYSCLARVALANKEAPNAL